MSQDYTIQPIFPCNCRVVLPDRLRIALNYPLIILIIVIPPECDIPGKAAVNRPAEVACPGKNLPIERSMLVPRQCVERFNVLRHCEQVYFAQHLDVASFCFLLEPDDILLLSGRDVNDFQSLYMNLESAFLVCFNQIKQPNVPRKAVE